MALRLHLLFLQLVLEIVRRVQPLEKLRPTHEHRVHLRADLLISTADPLARGRAVASVASGEWCEWWMGGGLAAAGGRGGGGSPHLQHGEVPVLGCDEAVRLVVRERHPRDRTDLPCSGSKGGR